jgi:hypothetical protein
MWSGPLRHGRCACCALWQVVYGADKQVWSRVRNALRKGEARDGSVTLVLERRADAAVGAALGSSSSRSSSRGASSGSG